jgi:hypothetical protein
MSGGYFDYQESYLGYIAEQLQRDIDFNNVEYDSSKPIDTPYGFQHQPETIEYLKIMVDELQRLQELLHEYDYTVSGESSKERFLEKARAAYKKGEVEKC